MAPLLGALPYGSHGRARRAGRETVDHGKCAVAVDSNLTLMLIPGSNFITAAYPERAFVGPPSPTKGGVSLNSEDRCPRRPSLLAGGTPLLHHDPPHRISGVR